MPSCGTPFHSLQATSQALQPMQIEVSVKKPLRDGGASQPACAAGPAGPGGGEGLVQAQVAVTRVDVGVAAALVGRVAVGHEVPPSGPASVSRPAGACPSPTWPWVECPRLPASLGWRPSGPSGGVRCWLPVATVTCARSRCAAT